MGGFKASFSGLNLIAGDSILLRGIYHTTQFTDSLQCSAGDAHWGSLVYRFNYANQCGATLLGASTPLSIGMNTVYAAVGYALAEFPAQVPPNSCANFVFSKVFATANDIGITNLGKRYAEIEWVLPAGLIFNNVAGNLVLTSDYDGSIISPLNGYPVVINNKLIVRYDYQTTGTTFFNILLKLCNDCSLPTGGTATLQMNSRLVWNENCSPKQWAVLDCKTLTTTIGACGSTPCVAGGLDVDFATSNIGRSNFGLPDNNNDGLPDAAGVIDLSKVNENRYAEGDTIKFNIKSIIRAGTTPQFLYAGVDITIDSSAWQSAGSVTVKIYDISSNNMHTCTLPIIFYGNSINLSFASCVPSGFLFEDGDSIRVVFNLRVKERGTGNQYQANPIISVAPWSSNTANPSSVQKQSCSGFANSYVIFYQSAFMQNVEANIFNACSGGGVSYMGMNIYTNEFGQTNGNAFPYEYRKATQLDSATFTIDGNYDFAGVVRLSYYKSLGNGVINYTLPTNAYTVNGNIIKVNLNSVWNTTNDLTISTAANVVTLQVGIYPKCTAPVYISSFGTMQAWVKSFRVTATAAPAYNGFTNFSGTQLTGGIQTAALNITYNPKPELTLGSAIANVSTNNAVAIWNLTLNNVNNNISPNTFLYIRNNGSLVVTQVKDIATNTIIMPNSNGFYEIGTIAAAASKKYEITSTLHQCSIDSIQVTTGWGCSGYPSNINNYACGINAVLKADANSSNLDASFSTTNTGVNGTFILCQPFAISSIINSNLLGNLASETYKVVLPKYINYVNNSLQTIYPVGGSYASSSYNPSIISTPSGDTLVFALNNLTGGIGLTGAGDLTHSQIKVKFDVSASCGYVSGKTVTAVYTGTSICGASLPTLIKSSVPINIEGATGSSKYLVSLTTPTNATACLAAKTAIVTVYNTDTTAAIINDSLLINIPAGLIFIPNSVVALNNAPSTLVPTVNDTSYKLPVKIGLMPGDSMKLSFQFNADGTGNGIKIISATATQNLSINCGLGICNSQLIVGLQVTASINTISCANLQVTKTASPMTVNIGSNTTYTIIVKNIGLGNATNVIVNDVLPASVSYISSYATHGNYVSSDWTIAAMPSGVSDTLHITTTATIIGSAINTAYIKSISGVPESNTNNDTSSVAITISIRPNAGADKFIECGSTQTSDTLKGFPIGGVWTALSSNPTGIIIGATNNGDAIINLITSPLQGIWRFLYSLNGDADTMVLNIGIVGNPMPAVNMGSNPVCKNGEVQLCPTVWGWSNFQWYKNGVAIAAPIGTSSCITLDSSGIGTYTLAASNSMGCWTSQSAAIVVTYDSTCNGGVTGGGSGGVESKTLGDVIAVRLYGNTINSITENASPETQIKFIHSSTIVNGVQDLTLNALVPANISTANAAYISTPTDLLTFTNAVELLSVDYFRNKVRRAVVFGTKTLGDVYSHTKPICDRLKGAELLEVKNIIVNGFNLMAYKIKQRTGETEYVINLSAGTAVNRNTISLQSNWFTNSYQQDDKLYNFQLWAVSYDIAKSIASEIITKLQANGTVYSVTNTDFPKTYISKGNRQGTVLNITIQNNTNFTSGYFQLKEKANENSVITTRTVAFTIQPNNQTTIQLAVSDNYESNIYVFVNNKLTDLVYLSDGTWSLNYNKNTTSISTFNVTNESNISNVTNEMKLFRNVAVTGISKDYITIYKTMLGGGLEQNVNTFKSLAFNANTVGSNKVKVTLVKKSITNWSEQYCYTMELDGNKEYGIDLNKFKSIKFIDAINPYDIVAVNFSFLNSRNVATTMSIDLSKARFTNSAIATAIEVKTVAVYPNPSNGKFTASFTSEIASSLVLKVIETATGRIVKTQFINAAKGANQVAVALDNTTSTSGLYIVSLEGDGISFNAAKLIINKK